MTTENGTDGAQLADEIRLLVDLVVDEPSPGSTVCSRPVTDTENTDTGTEADTPTGAAGTGAEGSGRLVPVVRRGGGVPRRTCGRRGADRGTRDPTVGVVAGCARGPVGTGGRHPHARFSSRAELATARGAPRWSGSARDGPTS